MLDYFLVYLRLIFKRFLRQVDHLLESNLHTEYSIKSGRNIMNTQKKRKLSDNGEQEEDSAARSPALHESCKVSVARWSFLGPISISFYPKVGQRYGPKWSSQIIFNVMHNIT